MSQEGSTTRAFLSRLERDQELVRRLKLGKTYEKRLASALKDPQMRAYLETGLKAIANVSILLTDIPEEITPIEAVLNAASAVIKGRLVEKAMWVAKNPGKPFPGYD